jgi:hypothetical protein
LEVLFQHLLGGTDETHEKLEDSRCLALGDEGVGWWGKWTVLGCEQGGPSAVTAFDRNCGITVGRREVALGRCFDVNIVRATLGQNFAHM